MLHMIPAQQPQMYQQPAQTMPAPLANIGQPMHQLASTKSNRGWILAGGFHVVYMVSLLVLSLVYAMFDPAPDWVGVKVRVRVRVQASMPLTRSRR